MASEATGKATRERPVFAHHPGDLKTLLTLVQDGYQRNDVAEELLVGSQSMGYSSKSVPIDAIFSKVRLTEAREVPKKTGDASRQGTAAESERMAHIFTERAEQAKCVAMEDVLDMASRPSFGLRVSCRRSSRILVVGRAGSGKTTVFARKAALDWSRGKIWPQIEFLFALSLRQKSVHEATTLHDLIQLEHLGIMCWDMVEEVRSYIGEHWDRVCIILDGLDEVKLNICSDYVQKIIQGQALTQAHVVVTSRPSNEVLVLDRDYPFKTRLELMGFCREEMSEYVRRVLKKDHAADFLLQVNSCPQLAAHLQSPLNCVNACAAYRAGTKNLPTTLQAMTTTIMDAVVRHTPNKLSNADPVSTDWSNVDAELKASANPVVASFAFIALAEWINVFWREHSKRLELSQNTRALDRLVSNEDFALDHLLRFVWSGQIPEESGRHLLDVAASMSLGSETPRLLHEAFAKSGIANEDQKTPLCMAVENDCSSAVAVLIDAGASLDCAAKTGRHLLEVAASMPLGSETAQLLCESFAKSDIANEDGNTLLHLLAKRSDGKQAVEAAIKAGANLDAVNQLFNKLNSVFVKRLFNLFGISVPFPQPLGIAISDILTYLTSFSAIEGPVQALEREEVPCCATGNLEATLQPWFDSVVIDAEWPSHPQISHPTVPVPTGNLDGKLKPLGVTEYFAAVVVLAKHAYASLLRASAGEELQADPQRPLEALRVAVELASKHITANLQAAGVGADEALHLLGLEDDWQSSDEELHTDPKEERHAARRLTQGAVEAEEVVARLFTLQERQSQGEETDDGMSVGSELLESGDTGLGTSCDTSYLSRASSRGEVSGQDKEKDLERSWRLFYPRTADSVDRQVMSDDEEEQSDDDYNIETVTPSVLSPQMQITRRNSPPFDILLPPLEDDCQSSDEEPHTDPKEEGHAARRLTQGAGKAAAEVVARLFTFQERQSQGEETDDGMSVGSDLLESGDTGLGTSCDTSYLSRASSRGEVSGQDKEKDLERSWRLFYPSTDDSVDRQVMSDDVEEQNGDDEEEQSDDEIYIETVTPSVLSPQMQITPQNSPPSDSLLQPSSSISLRLSPGNSAAAAGSDPCEGGDEAGPSSNGGSISYSPDERLPLVIECTDKGLNSGDKLHHVERSHSMSASLSARPRREQAMHLPLLASRHFRESQAEPLEEVNVPAKLWKDGEDLEQRSPDSSSPSSPVAKSTPNVLLLKGEPRAAVSSAAGAPSHRTPKAQKKKTKQSKTTRRGWSMHCPLMTLAASSSPLTRRRPPSPAQVTTEAQACSQRHDAQEVTLTDSWMLVSHEDAAGTPGEPMFRTHVEENRERQKKKKMKKSDQKRKKSDQKRKKSDQKRKKSDQKKS